MSIKNRLQQKVWMYEKRRSDIRRKYGFRGHDKMPVVRNLTKKLCTYRRQIKRTEQVFLKIEEINGHIKSFLGVDCKRQKNHKDKTNTLARNILYKYCLENGIRSNFISEFVGLKYTSRASVQRKIFTASFKTNKHNKTTYHKFLNFIKSTY